MRKQITKKRANTINNSQMKYKWLLPLKIKLSHNTSKNGFILD